MSADRAYLGDSVYVEIDGDLVILTTENGGPPSNVIYLEPEVIEAFQKYLKDNQQVPS